MHRRESKKERETDSFAFLFCFPAVIAFKNLPKSFVRLDFRAFLC